MIKNLSLYLKLTLLFCCCITCANSIFGATFLVKDGKPRADIVISEKPIRTIQLAALELREYLEKIRGASLGIVTAPGTNVAVHIYVGKSKYTDGLNISDEGLQADAVKHGWNRSVNCLELLLVRTLGN